MTTEEAVALERSGRLAEAEAAYREIAASAPNDARAVHLLGILLFRNGYHDEAVKHLRHAIELEPDDWQFVKNLAAVLGSLNNLDDALRFAEKAVELKPDSAETWNNLGVTLERLERLDEAVGAYRNAVHADPAFAQGYNQLATVLRKLGRLAEAVENHRKALELNADAAACSNLALTLIELGEQDQAAHWLRESLKHDPSDHRVHSNLLYVMLHQSNVSAGQSLTAARAWAHRHARPRLTVHDPECRALPGRRLRIGYVSADFREHPVARFLMPILSNHDRDSFEVFAYSDVRRADETTRQIQQKVEHWREAAQLSDEQLVGAVRRDEIDILIDLAGHTAGNRLLVFAQRPAPVQISYLGYPSTTGMPAIQYRITDGTVDPVGNEAYYSEKLLRLPRCAWCYEPSDSTPDVGPPPVESAGRITFAALHRQAKLTPLIVRLWAQIMRALPDSRLLISSDSVSRGEPTVLYRLKRLGIDSDRVETVARSGHDRYLQVYNRCDIALDCLTPRNLWIKAA